jgi:hypothetical protein
MIIAQLTEEETAAVEAGLSTNRSMQPRYGNDPNYLRDFNTALLGYRGFAERLAGDAFRKIDYVLYPKLENLEEGQELKLEGVTFTHVKRSEGLSITAVDEEGIQRFRINWKPDVREGWEGTPTAPQMFDVTIQACPEKDPQYAYAECLAHGALTRTPDDRIETTCGGTLWSHNFFEFMDAMDLLRPALAAEIAEMPRQKPMSDKVPYSFDELDKSMVREVVRIDGGLPGRLARHVVSVMIDERGRTILESLAGRAAEIATWLEDQGCVWGGAAMTSRDRDNVMYAVRSEETGKLALLYNARNDGGPYTAFLAWQDLEAGTATIAAARGGQHIFRTVEAFLRGDSVDAPTATIDLATGRHDLGPEMVGTSVIDLAMCHVRFTEDDLAEVASGEIEMDDRFERVEDFEFFIEANSGFYLDEDDVAPYSQAEL